MSFGLRSEEIEMIRTAFREFPAIRRVVIFGSRAMGNHKRGSDVDMTIEGRIDRGTLARVRLRLNDELPLPYEFDIFDMKAIKSKSLIGHIKKFGKVFYSRG